MPGIDVAAAVVTEVASVEQIRHALVAVRAGRHWVDSGVGVEESQILPVPESGPMRAFEILPGDVRRTFIIQQADEEADAIVHTSAPSAGDICGSDRPEG